MEKSIEEKLRKEKIKEKENMIDREKEKHQRLKEINELKKEISRKN